MTIKRMDNILIVVDDLEAARAFFAELGLELEGETQVEGPSVDSLIGLKDVRARLAFMRTPDGHGPRVDRRGRRSRPPRPSPKRRRATGPRRGAGCPARPRSRWGPASSGPPGCARRPAPRGSRGRTAGACVAWCPSLQQAD